MNWEVLFRGAVALLIAVMTAFLARAVWEVYGMTPEATGVEALQRLTDSGVEHPVTAVLLNFRAYDTLLEVLVLTVAFWGAWSIRMHGEQALSRSPTILLQRVSAVLVPVLVMIAVYLIWAGSHQPGGEFQAGAVLGAAGILSLLVGRAVPGAFRAFARHMLVVLGGAVFVAVGILGWLMTGHVLSYRPGWEKPLMLIVEVAAAISIGFIITALFAGSVERLSGDVETTPVGWGAYTGAGEVEYRNIGVLNLGTGEGDSDGD